jgi:multicomponent K+:H+ antiporter subunit E
MMRRLIAIVLPAPILSALLFLAWLMLSGSASAGHLLLAAVFALAIPWFSERFRPDKPRLRAWGTIARLGLVVLRDIVVSNIDVARRVLGPEAAIRSRFVWVPLSIRDPHGIVALAGIITMTPGTLSSELSEDRRGLLVHALHCEDEAALVADIKTRYERPLMEIFE